MFSDYKCMADIVDDRLECEIKKALNKKTLVELKTFAKENKIKILARATKTDIIEKNFRCEKKTLRRMN